MAHGHHRHRRSVSVHESPRAWEASDPTSDQLRRGLSSVRRSDLPVATVSQVASIDRRYQAMVRRALKVYSPPPAKRVSPRGVYAPRMERLAFFDPRRILVCLKRKVRREVLFSMDFRRRRGGSGAKRKRFNVESLISCGR